jgi:Cu/Ag efflux pump CusA
VQNYQPEEIDAALRGSDSNLVVRVYGHDLDLLYEKAQEVATTIAGIDGIVESQPVLSQEEPQVEIVVNLAAAEQHGIKPGDVRRQATTLLSGIQVGNLFEEQKVFDVVVWGVPEIRNDLTNINELMIDTPAGSQIALGEVADVRIAPAATTIEREAVSRYVDVIATVDGRSLEVVSADIESRLQGIELPFEFHIELLSDAQSLQTTRQRLLAIALAALIGVYLLMQAAFSSWRLSFAIFLTLPVALVGGVVAALLGGGVLSTGSLFGFYALLALAVRNGLVMIHHLQLRTAVEDGSAKHDQVVREALERVTPVMMTALAVAVAFLSFLFAGNMAGNELVRPMAVVILGGLVTSTLFTLFILPAVFIRWPATMPVPAVAPAGSLPVPEAA